VLLDGRVGHGDDGAVQRDHHHAQRHRQQGQARQALQSSIRELHGGAGSLTAYLAAMRLIDSTPSLLAAYLRSVHDHDDEIIEVLARREGVDPVADRRPRVLAAVIGALVFLANKDWQASDKESPEDLAAAFDAYADVVIPALAGHWRSAPSPRDA
jgi:MftR C-terminal domain